jgi:arginine-tRNA-protein transferase
MSRERRRLARRKEDDEVLPGDGPSATTSSTPPEEDEDDQPILHSDPITAANSDLSLLTLGMPGVLTPAQLREQVDLDAMRVSIGSGHIVRVDRLVAWERQRDVTREGLENEEDDELVDKGTLKGLFAEFAAAVGPRVAREGVVDFG